MSGLYWSAGLIVTSKPAKIEGTLGYPDAEIDLEASL